MSKGIPFFLFVWYVYFRNMKSIKHLVSILTGVVLILCIWMAWKASSIEEGVVSSGLHLVFCIQLFVSLFCIRIALSSTRKIRFLTYALALTIIILSTYSWTQPSELLVTGKISLGLLPILLGSTLILLLDHSSKMSKILQVLLGIIALSLSCFVFVGVSKYIMYTTLLVGMVIASIGTVGLLIFGRRK